MPNEFRVNGKIIRLMVGFITDIEDMDGIVYYARPDLTLGAGFGTAISTQGGPKVQEELKKIRQRQRYRCRRHRRGKPSSPVHPARCRPPVPGRG